MEKLNDPEHINWTARFHKILRKLNRTFPVENFREFRFVLINMFEAVQQDIKEMQTVLHFTLSMNSRTRTSEPTKREKAPKGQPPTGAPAKHCTVCCRYFHEGTTCRLKESKYANYANKPYVGSEAHARLVKDKGIQATFIPLGGSVNNSNLKRKAESAPSERPNRPRIKKDWKNNKVEQVYSLSSTPTSTPTSSNFLSVTLTSLPWQEESVSVEGEALLNTGSLAGDFVSERLVEEYSLVPIVTANYRTVCSGLSNECVKINTILLLRVTLVNEIVNKNKSFDIEATILKNTPIDLIIGRNTIKKHKLFDQIPSLLGGKDLIPERVPTSECIKRKCDCRRRWCLNTL